MTTSSSVSNTCLENIQFDIVTLRIRYRLNGVSWKLTASNLIVLVNSEIIVSRKIIVSLLAISIKEQIASRVASQVM